MTALCIQLFVLFVSAICLEPHISDKLMTRLFGNYENGVALIIGIQAVALVIHFIIVNPA